MTNYERREAIKHTLKQKNIVPINIFLDGIFRINFALNENGSITALYEPISDVQEEFDSRKYHFDKRKYTDTGFYFVAAKREGDEGLYQGDYYLVDEESKMIIPCERERFEDVYVISAERIQMGRIKAALIDELTLYIAKNPEKAKDIPAKTFGAVKDLDKMILKTYKGLKEEENKEKRLDEKAVDQIKEEVAIMNSAFNKKEREISGKLDTRLFERDRSL